MERPIPYSGEQPYIFISYSHRNSDLILPIVQRLQRDGYRVWFDDGIDPGSEWDENIAHRINNCSYLLAFLSEDYIKSQNCRDELSFARDKNKPRLLVYLDEVKLPDGMSMRLNRLQAVYWSKYRTEEAAMQKISEAKGIEVCREVPEPKAAPEAPKVSEAPAEPAPLKGKSALLPEELQKRKKKKKITSIIMFSSMAVLLALMVVILVKTFNHSLVPSKPAPEATESFGWTDAPEEGNQTLEHPVIAPGFDRQENYRVFLSAPMSVRDFNDSVDALEKRLKLLCGDSSYDLKIDRTNSTVELTLPSPAFEGLAVADTVEWCLSKPGRLYAFKQGSTNLVSTKVERIDPQMIVSISSKIGTVDGFKAASYGILSDTYPYLELVLTSQGAQAARVYGNKVCIGYDVLYESAPRAFATVRSADSDNIYYLIVPGADQATLDLIAQCILEPLTMEFEMRMESVCYWENTERAQAPGKNQVSLSELDGDTVTVTVKPYGEDALTSEEMLFEPILKERLDCLEQPYAFGFTESHNAFAFRTSLDRFGSEVLDLLTKKYSSFRISIADDYKDIYDPVYSVEKKADGSLSAALLLKEYELERVTEFIGDNKQVYFGTTNHILCGVSRVALDSNTFELAINADTGEAYGSEQAWLFNLIESVMYGDESETSFASDIQIDSDPFADKPDESRYGFRLQINADKDS